MKDLDLITINGTFNIEMRTDGRIGIYYHTEDDHNTIMLNKEQFTLRGASVGIQPLPYKIKDKNVYYNEVWNAAIEEAAKAIQHESDGMMHDEIIRKLKK